MEKVNLDALIPREDFDVLSSNQVFGTQKGTISINDLKRSEFFFSVLRKPDFQRETNEWDVPKICDFIESFLDGDLIPAVILWRSSSGYIFVIDGSHRLSALASWINDDYGDGEISKSFYEGVIPYEQTEIALHTRALVNSRVGLFKDYISAIENPDDVKPEIVKRAKNLGALAIQLQWVEGNSSKAESSFFKINQQASPIDSTELRVLKARKQPNGIAARAIVRSGKGHKYWSAFSADKQLAVQDLAKEINEILFNPVLKTPIKSLDIPIGGKLYAAQSLPLVLDFINIVNGVDITGFGLTSDTDGNQTIRYLDKCKKIAQRINSSHPSSLGLHPAVYFYSPNGRHKTASFIAVTALVLEFEKRDYFNKFTKIRAKFEELLITHDYLVQQIVRKKRSAKAGYENMKDFYLSCIENLLSGMDVEEAIDDIVKQDKYKYLALIGQENEILKRDFSQETKSATYITEALKYALRCKICGGYLHSNSISIDHIIRKEDGGLGSRENAQLTHPYCNTTVKN